MRLHSLAQERVRLTEEERFAIAHIILGNPSYKYHFTITLDGQKLLRGGNDNEDYKGVSIGLSEYGRNGAYGGANGYMGGIKEENIIFDESMVTYETA